MQHKWKIKPESIQVGGLNFPIKMAPNLLINRRECGNSCFEVNKGLEIDPASDCEIKSLTLLHEVVHTIDYVFLQKVLEEGQIDGIAQGLLQILQQWGVEFDWD